MSHLLTEMSRCFKEFWSEDYFISSVLTKFISCVWTMSSTRMAVSWSGLRASPKENLKERGLLQAYENELNGNISGLQKNKKKKL